MLVEIRADPGPPSSQKTDVRAEVTLPLLWIYEADMMLMSDEVVGSLSDDSPG